MQNRPGVSPLSQSDLTGFTPPPSFGPFRVLHQIGTGTLGPVFRTYEPAQDRLVAVKAFRLDITPEQARAIADELQRVADAGLDHPSIVLVIGAGVEGALAYSASEYVAAESLDIALRHYAPASLDMVLPFITQLAGAVDFARAAGIGHGALHPRDIFVTPEEARATGFGVVQALEATGLRAPVRRPYTAPERVDGGAWDVTADVYSLGAIAFELLTGRRPVGSEIGPLGSTAGPHGDEVARVISRALADDPTVRFPSALAFAAALEASSRGERTTAAIDEVRAVVAGGATPAAVDRDPASASDVHELSVEPEHEDAAVHREADVADIQLRDQEPPVSEWLEHRTATNADPQPTREPEWEAATERSPESGQQAPPQAGEPDVFLRRPNEVESRLDEPAPEEASAIGPSMFDLDRDDEDGGIPEVQHSGFQPGILDPGYQSEPPPPEGWDQHAPLASDDRGGAGETPVADRERPSEEPARRPPAIPAASRAPRPRSVVLPVAITLLLGLFVGFLAGYLVFVRDGNGITTPATGTPGGAAVSQPPTESETAGRQAGAPTQQPRAPERSSPSPGTRTPRATPAPRATEPARPAPARAAPSPAPARGRLVVRSNPSGAQVFVNGRRRGTTPLALRDLTPGAYTIRVSREGFADVSRRLDVGGSGVRDITLRLERRTSPAPATFTGSLYVDSRPRGARVLLDGKDVGTTPMQMGDVRAGAHVVRLELKDHRTWTASTRVVAGQTVRVTGSLERLR